MNRKDAFLQHQAQITHNPFLLHVTCNMYKDYTVVVYLKKFLKWKKCEKIIEKCSYLKRDRSVI